MHRRLWVRVVGVSVGGLLVGGLSGLAEEHGGQEHGGQEHGGATSAPAQPEAKARGGASSTALPPGAKAHREPSAEQIRQAIRDHIARASDKSDGAFRIHDDVTGATRALKLIQVHQRVGKTGSLYYSCTDMRDMTTGQLLDLDYDVDASGEGLKVVDVRIHKVEGKPRYTYDDHDRRVPVTQ